MEGYGGVFGVELKAARIEIERGLFDGPVWLNPHLLQICIWLLFESNHNGEWVTVKTGRGETEVYVEPGSFVFQRTRAAKELDVHPETLRKRIDKLKTIGFLTSLKFPHYVLITVKKKALYGLGTGQVQGKYRASTGQTPALPFKSLVYMAVGAQSKTF